MRKKKLDQVVYDSIVEKIETRQLNEKEHITEQVIADELEISRTPVRRAFSRLAADNYLEYTENFGVRVKKQQVDKRNFQERIDFIEHLINYYLFNLEKRLLIFDVSELKNILELLKESITEETNQFETSQYYFWKELLNYNKNQYANQNILKAFEEILFAEGHVRFILKSSRSIILKHSSQLVNLLEEEDYPLSRRELRILFNQLKLNMIESN